MSAQQKVTSDLYEYVDESAIDADLLCNICHSPFNDSRCTPCSHVFCQECITEWIEGNNASCPICRQALSSQELTSVPRPLRNMVDKLRVRCKICGHSELLRGDFDNHIEKVCSKMEVSCLLSNIKCTWTGRRDQLNNHLDICTHIRSLQPIIDSYVAQNKQLKVQMDEYQNEVRQLKDQISQLKREKNSCNIESQRMKNAETRMNVQIHEQQNEIRDLNDRIAQLKDDISKHSSGNRQIRQQFRERQTPPIFPTNPLRSTLGATNIDIQNGSTVAGGKSRGKSFDQFNSPHGLYVDDDQTLYVADYANHRVIQWKCGATNGHVIAGGSGQGILRNQLNYPTDVVVDKSNDFFIISDRGNGRIVRYPRHNNTHIRVMSNIDCFGLALDSNGCLYVSSYNKHEVRRYEAGDMSGTVVAGGNGQGDQLNQLYYPAFICVDRDHAVYVADSYNHRVMKWRRGAREGVIVAGGRGQGKSSKQLSFPHGVIVDQSETIYVADSDNHRIMRWSKGATSGTVLVGVNEKGSQANQLNCPMTLSFDRQGNLYVSDSGNHRIQKLIIDPNFRL